MGHWTKDRWAQSGGCPGGKNDKPVGAKQVHSQADTESSTGLSRFVVYDLLYSSDAEDGGIQQVQVVDHGSNPRHTRVEVQGVPANRVIDSNVDITIIGGDLFK